MSKAFQNAIRKYFFIKYFLSYVLESDSTAGINITQGVRLTLKPFECCSGSYPEYHLLRGYSFEIILLIFIFALKIHFYVKIKIRGTSNDFDLDK